MAAALLRERTLVVARLRLRERHVIPAGEGSGSDLETAPRSSTVDLAQEWTGGEIDSATRATLLARLAALDRALEKLRSEDYGRGGGCGEPIPPRRLEAMPGAMFCVPCQEARERATRRREPIPRGRREQVEGGSGG